MKKKALYGDNALIQVSLLQVSAVVTFFSEISNPQHQKKVTLCESFEITVILLEIDFALILRFNSYTPNSRISYLSSVFQNINMILPRIKAKRWDKIR